ncbi:polyadenylate-binding protein, cytoplasmic and nuclear-like [Panthera leo]|uniref:polyadenylate-binding protein, cytoplasmic and nuclear-like n=1 Tax=Panthera leo TaxID=9689 RepID=UPI001C6A3AA2|nr:polyadenylate-binding protein, cytoplasmic and nuclear-like [Panthera leo]
MELFSCRWAQRLGPATSGGATPRTSAWGAGCPVSRCPTRARIPAGRLGPSGRRPLGPPLPGRTEGPRPPPASPEPAAQRPPPHPPGDAAKWGPGGWAAAVWGLFFQSKASEPQSLTSSLLLGASPKAFKRRPRLATCPHLHRTDLQIPASCPSPRMAVTAALFTSKHSPLCAALRSNLITCAVTAGMG